MDRGGRFGFGHDDLEDDHMDPLAVSQEVALAALAALEQELDALADVAAAGNEREKRLEAELAEAHLSLETYQAALSGTQHVRDNYKARALAAEARVNELAKWAGIRGEAAEADNSRLREALREIAELRLDEEVAADLAISRARRTMQAIARAALADKEGT